jgi:carbon-monoxide dehydrogenase large subunit
MPGPAVRRREDFRFITGRGRFTDDVRLPQLAHAAIVRAPHAHAVVKSLSADAARRAPGVIAVLTAADAEADGIAMLSASVNVKRPDGSDAPDTPRPLLARDHVRFVGEPLAIVIAESAAAAEDAAELVEADYEPLPAIVGVQQALAPGAPVLWDEAPDNIAYSWRKGDDAAIDAILANAAHVTRAELTISRVTAAPVEPRVAVGAVEDGRLVLRTSTQGPHQARNLMASALKLDPSEVRVVAEDVGGSFGMKAGLYREDVLVLWAARRLRRPVKWTSTRAQAFLSDEHARDILATTELALDADGNFLAFRARLDNDIGAYLSGRSLPVIFNIGGISGVYRTPAISGELRGVFSNTAPTGPYRGAGRPEATYVLERTIDIAARDIGADPFELRRRNLIPAEAMPYDTRFVYTYDCGDFAANMEHAAKLADRDGFAARRDAARARGKLRGLGVANALEVAGGPFVRPTRDSARLTVEPDGTIVLDSGSMSVGQGLETSTAELAAAGLGVSSERIAYSQGDSDRLGVAHGSGGSSATPVGATAVHLAVERLIEVARARAAEVLEAAPSDIDYSAGALRVVGTDRVVTLQELAAGAVVHAGARPSDMEPLSAEAEFHPDSVTYPNGCHICEVEVDPETGRVEMVGYVAVEDVGRVLNPLLVEGQLHGGIAQGAGQALRELIVHDASGELLTGTFNDYAMPLASSFCDFQIANREVPATANPLGVKGVGEAGNVGSLVVAMNAVCDALKDYGVTHLDMPATPERIWAITKGRMPPSE